MLKQFILEYEKDIKKNNKTCNNKNILYILYLFSILGGFLLILSKDFILFFICLELLNFSSLVILLYKENKFSTNITFIYLILNNLSGILILLGILYLYIESNIIDFLEIENFFNSFYSISNFTNLNKKLELSSYSTSTLIESVKNNSFLSFLNYLNNKLFKFLNLFFLYFQEISSKTTYNLATYLIFLGLLIKLGVTPFHYIILILYKTLPNIIILYHSIIPKIIYIFILYNLYFLINKTIYIYILLSFLIGAIIGLNNKSIKKLLAASSIFNMGFLLLSLYNIFFYIYYNSLELNYINLLTSKINNGFSTHNLYLSFFPFNILHFLLLYIINNINIFSILILFSNIKNLIDLKYLHSIYPFISFLFLISILSFIGIPPLGGFYAKYYIFFNSILNLNFFSSYIIILLIIFSILSIIISSIFYLSFIKYLINSNSYFYIINNIKILYIYPNSISYILSLTFTFIFFFSFFYIYYIFILNLFSF